MENVFLIIGEVVCFVGGSIVALSMLAALGYVCGECFVRLSRKYRQIYKAESMIHEYRKNRNNYMYWKNMVKGDDYDKS